MYPRNNLPRVSPICPAGATASGESLLGDALRVVPSPAASPSTSPMAGIVPLILSTTVKHFQLAVHRGDVNLIRQSIASGRAWAADRDEQDITPLHWVVISPHIATSSSKAQRSMPLTISLPLPSNGWLATATRNTQGYSTLHLVTHSPSIMPLLYLLHQPISVDERDSAGHTALM